MATFRARAPLRLGLAGGGTDLAAYSDLYGGVVLNATIDRYASVHITTRTDSRLVLRADDIGKAEELPADIGLPIREGLILHRAVWRYFMLAYNGGMPMGLTIATNNDVPAGSGLGASSALVVALIEAFALLFKAPLGPYDIAQLAYAIERVQLGLLGGKQDQYAAAFGGVNYIEFLRESAGVVVNPLRMRRDILNEFESSLVICFSGQSRESADIIAEQVGGLESMDDSKIAAMHAIKHSAITMKGRMLSGDLRAMAHELHAAWEAKKSTAKSISNAHVDTLLEVALSAGAWAGKVSGAGGGGFIFLMSDPADRFRVIQSLNQAGGDASTVKLTFSGVEGWEVRDDARSRDAFSGPTS